MMNGSSRRHFLTRAAGTLGSIGFTPYATLADASAAPLSAGQSVVDITPPAGIELAGFHRSADNPRVVEGVRRPAALRTLLLHVQGTRFAIISVDILGVSEAMAQRVKRRVSQRCGIPERHVLLCATHTHSMPSFRFLRQWGAVPRRFMRTVEDRIVQSVSEAITDLAPAELYVGCQPTQGANFNRTSDTWKTEQDFTDRSTDTERWLDRRVRVLHFERRAPKPNLLWYHFSAHPVCYTDSQAGPDWPGHVADLVRQQHAIIPSLLQGHIGDVNPGDGKPWLGRPQETSKIVADGIDRAIQDARRVPIQQYCFSAEPVRLPLDIRLFLKQLETYQREPDRCTGGEWVDAGFAADWYPSASQWPKRQTFLASPLSTLRLGDVVVMFHAAELYSYYGLRILHDSPFPDTLLVGYTDAFSGYLTDPAAYSDGEYAAIVVPKILDLPPFTPHAAHHLTDRAHAMLRRIAS